MQAETSRGWQTLGLELAAHAPDLPSTLGLLSTRIQEAVGLVPVLVFLYDADSAQYDLYQASQSAVPEGTYHSIPGDGQLVHWLEACTEPICDWATQNPHPVQDLHTAERYLLESLNPALFLPMRSWSLHVAKGRGLGGWVAIGPRPSGRSYSSNDLAVLAALASQAALAIEVVRLHQALKEADASGSEFIDFVAHELKQPMTAIQGYAKMLMMGIGGELPDTHRQFAQVINANAERMGRLINNLLEASRLEAGRITLQLAPVELREIVDEATAVVRGEIEARQQTLHVGVPADLPPVLGDRERLLQVLINLSSNAYKCAPQGGSIQITAEELTSSVEAAGHLVVSIRDSGIGVSDYELSQMGEKFHQAKDEVGRTQPGSGLELYVARQLIALHGSQLVIRSEPDRGSAFRFTLRITSD
jgi:signal transduction histidine kinase